MLSGEQIASFRFYFMNDIARKYREPNFQICHHRPHVPRPLRHAPAVTGSCSRLSTTQLLYSSLSCQPQQTAARSDQKMRARGAFGTTRAQKQDGSSRGNPAGRQSARKGAGTMEVPIRRERNSSANASTRPRITEEEKQTAIQTGHSNQKGKRYSTSIDEREIRYPVFIFRTVKTQQQHPNNLFRWRTGRASRAASRPWPSAAGSLRTRRGQCRCRRECGGCGPTRNGTSSP